MLAAWPLTRIAGVPVPAPTSVPVPAEVKVKIVLRAFAADPPGNSSVAAQYAPLMEVRVGVPVGAGMAMKRSNVFAADSVLEPITASGPYRALIVSPLR